MKKFIIAAFAATFATAAFATEVKNFDGCDAFKVEGANYYNFVDPRCKTNQELYSSSKGEDKRAEFAKEEVKY